MVAGRDSPEAPLDPLARQRRVEAEPDGLAERTVVPVLWPWRRPGAGAEAPRGAAPRLRDRVAAFLRDGVDVELVQQRGIGRDLTVAFDARARCPHRGSRGERRAAGVAHEAVGAELRGGLVPCHR